MYELDIISDNSNQNLVQVPEKVLRMYNLKMLYLEGNDIEVLPCEFFPNLKLLSWLDLRNNQLKSLPENIAHHEHLENLLVSNNCLKSLPNQLGLVPKLKVLQLADNPITYPDKEILDQGIGSICKYLREEYYKSHEPVKLEDEERELRVIEQESSQALINKSKDNRINTREMYKSCRKNSSSGNLHPTITVKKLSKTSGLSPYQNDEKGQIVHKIMREPSKISVKSHYNNYNSQDHELKIRHQSNHELKANFLNKVKILLNEQEKILQQEKNLQALSSWRLEKKSEPPRSISGDVVEPPYATDNDYNSILSRADITKEINKLISRKKNPPRPIDIEKMINEVVGQLKQIENNFTTSKSPRSEIQEAEKQINTVMTIHKKLRMLQADNSRL